MTDRPRSAHGAATQATAIGYSDEYSFEEAFRNALSQLPSPACTYPDQLTRTEVVRIGSETGGIAGLDRLYMVVRRLPDPVCDREPQPDFPPPDLFTTEGREAEIPEGFALVHRVDKVALEVLESNPPQLRIFVHGEVNTSGWSDPRLILVPSKDSPKDGIQDVLFVARKPDGVVLPVIRPICTELDYGTFDPNRLRGIRVIADENQLLEKIEDTEPAKPRARIFGQD